MAETKNTIQPARRPRLKITGSEFLLIGVPVSREEFRESLRPLAKTIARMIWEQQQAEFKIQGKETPDLITSDRYNPISNNAGAQSPRSAKDAI